MSFNLANPEADIQYRSIELKTTQSYLLSGVSFLVTVVTLYPLKFSKVWMLHTNFACNYVFEQQESN